MAGLGFLVQAENHMGKCLQTANVTCRVGFSLTAIGAYYD